MKLSATFLGSTTVKKLEAAYGEHILVVGQDRFTRRQLAGVGCFNFLAAKNLTTISQSLGLTSLRDLFDRMPPAVLAVPHMGTISMAVLGAAFEIKKIGGDDPLGNWARTHAGDAKRAIVTFHTMKHRELAQIREEKAAIKKRKRERRNLAHATRVERFERRRSQAADDSRR